MSYIGNSPATSTEVADNSVTLAKMAHGTDGELITYDATGAPANVAVGTSGQVLTSGGAGVAPTFQAAAGGGKVLKVTTETNSTRASLSSSTDHTLWTTATFTKDDASSDLVVSAVLSFRGNGSSWSNGLFCSIDGTEKGTDGSAFHGVQESGDNSSANATHLMVVNKTFSGIATGSHDIRFGWKTKDGTSTQAWGQFNPNSSDSVALHQMASHVTILEVE